MTQPASNAFNWRVALKQALKAHKVSKSYAKSSFFVQLATVDKKTGRPANRTIVFRDFHDSHDILTFYTDSRSDKVAHISSNPAVEVCWYFPLTWQQFRVSGDAFAVTKAGLKGRDDLASLLVTRVEEEGEKRRSGDESQGTGGQTTHEVNSNDLVQPEAERDSTDSRSEKPNPILGVDDLFKLRHLKWASLNDNQRQQYGGIPPGSPLHLYPSTQPTVAGDEGSTADVGAGDVQSSALASSEEAFTLLYVVPNKVDFLDIKKDRRVALVREAPQGEWSCTEVKA